MRNLRRRRIRQAGYPNGPDIGGYARYAHDPRLFTYIGFFAAGHDFTLAWALPPRWILSEEGRYAVGVRETPGMLILRRIRRFRRVPARPGADSERARGRWR